MFYARPVPSRKAFHTSIGFCGLAVLVCIFSLQSSAVAVSQLTFDPGDLQFGEIVIGSAQTLSVSMSNSGSTNFTVSSITLNATGYTVQQLTLPLTLVPGQNVNFTVMFSPGTSGMASGNIAFNSNAAYLSVLGWGASSKSLTANPPALEFGNVEIPNSTTLPVTLTNNRSNSITISQESTSGTGYSISGLSLPLTLAPGGSFTFNVTFTPQAPGFINGNFKGLSSKNAVEVWVAFGGTGVPYTVGLSWTASTSQVVGYNVYRGPVSGGPYYRINSAPVPGTSYVDNTISPSDTYYYVTTAVNSNGQESAYSNETQAIIP